MQLSGLHILLTYKCTFECDHCFAWGSPWQEGTLTLDQIRTALQQAGELGSVEWIFFEGGEPYLYYATLVKGVEMAAQAGYKVGVVTNSYWAISPEDAVEWLRPLAGKVQELSVSSDLYHYSERLSQQAQNARLAAETLGLSVGVISIARPEESATSCSGQIPSGESAVIFRGRATEKLAGQARQYPWEQFTECPFEDLRDPGRVHLDPLGNLHICQGISLGNIFQTSLADICSAYDPDAHPVTGALLAGGPVELVRRYGLSHAEQYADACHLCYQGRLALRSRYPDILLPDQMYGIYTQ